MEQDMLAEGLDRLVDAERFTRLSRAKLYQLMNDGVLPFVKIGRCRRIPHRALIDLVAKHIVSVKAAPGAQEHVS